MVTLVCFYVHKLYLFIVLVSWLIQNNRLSMAEHFS